LSFGRAREAPSHPLMDFHSAPEFVPRLTATTQHALQAIRAAVQLPLMRFGVPPTYEAPGSDQHQVYLTWLCYAYRLFQPLDVSFLPEPPGLVSCRLRPWDSTLQRFVPLTKPVEPFSLPAPHGVVPRPNRETINLDEHPSAASDFRANISIERSFDKVPLPLGRFPKPQSED
jgi:hypothetical protein